MSAGVITEYVETDEQQIKFLLANRADALIDIPPSVQPLLAKFDKNSVLVFSDAVFSRTTFNVMVSKKSEWHNHLSKINEALKNMKLSGFYEGIYK